MRSITLLPAAAAALTTALLALGANAQFTRNGFTEIERGRSLAVAGDCESCHTAPGGMPFTGGRAIETPFGVIYSPNITPDKETGIGNWTDEQFYRALHEGISANGDHLYPAFPYPWYSKVTRDDSSAIRIFLQSLDPVVARRPPNALTWPLDYRGVMVGWNALFFSPGEFKPDPAKSADWNRGAYLVEGLGHCGACHAPTNALGASDTKDGLKGGNLQSWSAPALNSDLKTGIGAWSQDQIVTFLKTGRNERSSAYGPMAEVIDYSTSKMSDEDLRAIATYLKDMQAGPQETPPKPDASVAQAGQAIFVDNCSACHRSNGEGVPGIFPPLKADAVAQNRDPTTVIRLILQGGRTVPTDANPTPHAMPAFSWKLNDDEVAAVASYVRNAWGNVAAPVDAGTVTKLRRELSASAN